MIQTAFKKNQKSEIVFVKARMNAFGYQQMLHDHLLLFITLTEDNKIVFQQDNAPIHTASSGKSGFKTLESNYYLDQRKS